MSNNHLKTLNQPAPKDPSDPLGSVEHMVSQKVPDGVDRRAFLMRSALIGATAIILDRPISPQLRAARLAGRPPVPQLAPTLNVVKEQKGP
jgi:L-serine dehydratase